MSCIISVSLGVLLRARRRRKAEHVPAVKCGESTCHALGLSHVGTEGDRAQARAGLQTIRRGEGTCINRNRRGTSSSVSESVSVSTREQATNDIVTVPAPKVDVTV